MNSITLINPIFSFGNNDHPVCDIGFTVVPKRVSCLIDTGFTLGFAFQQQSLSKFRFTQGWVMSLMLGNGAPARGMVFAVDVILQYDGISKTIGQTSIVFMERSGEPLMGIETLRLFSPISLDWGIKTVTSGIS